MSGGDRLVAVYLTLKYYKGDSPAFFSRMSKNRRLLRFESLLRNSTNLPYDTIKKYVPMLIELGVCCFSDDGDFYMVGNDNLKVMFRSQKMIPIALGKNMIETSYNSYMVRIHSSSLKQAKSIVYKQNKSVLLLQKDNPSNLADFKAARKLSKRFPDGIEVTDEIVLSNEGFARLKNSERGYKAIGGYWKSRLKKLKLINTKRRGELISKCELESFLSFRKSLPREYIYQQGYIYRELPSKLIIL